MNAEDLIRAQETLVVDAIERFNARWQAAEHRAEVYTVPLHEGGEVPPLIPVRRVAGAAATRLSAEGLLRFARAPEQVPTTAWRLPGVVFCIEDLSAELHAINAAKDRLRELVKAEAATESERRKLVRRLFPGQSVLQLYRHAHVASPDVERIAFTWSPTTAASSTMTVRDAARLVEDRLAHGDFFDIDQRRSFEIAWQTLGRLNHGETRIIRRKTVATHPRVSLFEGRGRGAPKLMHHANLPVFVFGRDRLPVTPLKDFDVTQRRKRRSDQKLLVTLLNGLDLYVDGGARVGT